MTKHDPLETTLLDLFAQPDRPVAPSDAFANDLRERLLSELGDGSKPRKRALRFMSSVPAHGESPRIRPFGSVPGKRMTWVVGLEIVAIVALMLGIWNIWPDDDSQIPSQVPAVSVSAFATPAVVTDPESVPNPGFVGAWRDENLAPSDPFVQPVVLGQTLYRSGKIFLEDALTAAVPRFEAIDLTDGHQKWIVQLHAAGSPVATENSLYLTVFIGNPSTDAVRPTESALVALDAATGEQRWSVPMGDPTGREDYTTGRTGVSAVLDSETVYGADPNGTVYAVDAESGDLLWISTEATSSDAIPAIDAPIAYGPRSAGQLALGDGQLYVANTHGDVVALNAKTGGRIWSFNVIERFDISAESIQPIAVNGQLLVQIYGYPRYGADGGSFTMLMNVDPADGHQNWSKQLEGKNAIFEVVDDSKVALAFTDNSENAVIMVVGSQFGATVNGLTINSPIDFWTGMTIDAGNIYLNTQGGRLVEFDLESYTESWFFSTGQATIGDPIVTGDLIIVQDGDGTLIALDKASPAMHPDATPVS